MVKGFSLAPVTGPPQWHQTLSHALWKIVRESHINISVGTMLTVPKIPYSVIYVL